MIFLNNIIQGYSEGMVSKSEIVFYDQSCCLSSIYLNQLIKTFNEYIDTYPIESRSSSKVAENKAVLSICKVKT